MIADTIIISTLLRTVKNCLTEGVSFLFYERLKNVCAERKTSPSAVCIALGMSKSNVTEWKNGRSPKLDTVVQIAEHLGINPTELIPKQNGG